MADEHRPSILENAEMAPDWEDPEILYQRGMSAYRQRNWEAALIAFTRLKEVDPTWQGVDALIDEVHWFMQLEAIEPGQRAQALAKDRRLSDRSWWQIGPALVLLALALAVIIAAALGWVPSFGNKELEAQKRALYEQGYTALAAGDYEEAIRSFEELATLAPDEDAVKVALRQARRLYNLATRYQKAQDAIANEDWTTAAEELEAILAIDSTYKDAAELAVYVSRQQRLHAHFQKGKELFDQGKWAQAAAEFEQIQRLDREYRADVVAEYLFNAYLNEGMRLVKEEGDRPESVRLALQYLGAALSIHPRNKQAAEQRLLAGIYLDGLLAYINEDWETAIRRLQQVVDTAPDYASGKAVTYLFDALMHQGEALVSAGDYEGALTYFRRAVELPVPNADQAQTQIDRILAALTPPSTPTATPTPTVPPLPTATPTPLPTPTPTYTATPTATPTPTNTPTPPPPPPPTPTPVPPTPTPKPTPTPTWTPTFTPTPER